MSTRRKILLAVLSVCMVSIGAVPALDSESPTGSVCSVSSFFISDALAADSCTGWMKQNNGCSWRTCVDSKGKQYCQEACGKGTVNRVRCS